MLKIIAVAVGGACGALMRYGVYSTVGDISRGKFPWATFAVNCVGCYILGLLFEIAGVKIISEHVKMFLTVGFLGALTTFSTFSLETIQLLRDKEHVLGLVNLFGGIVVGLILCIAGILTGRQILKGFL